MNLRRILFTAIFSTSRATPANDEIYSRRREGGEREKIFSEGFRVPLRRTRALLFLGCFDYRFIHGGEVFWYAGCEPFISGRYEFIHWGGLR